MADQVICLRIRRKIQCKRPINISRPQKKSLYGAFFGLVFFAVFVEKSTFSGFFKIVVDFAIFIG